MADVFKVWSPDGRDEEDAEEIPKGPKYWAGEARDAEMAAYAHGEKRYSDCDCPEEQTIHVRDPEGALTKWTVYAERTVTFRAVESK